VKCSVNRNVGLLKELGEVSEVYAPVLLNAEFVLIKRNSAAEQAERALAAKYNKWDGDDKDAPWYPYPEEMDEEFNRYDEHTDIKHNPFLSHWVDVVERIQPVVRANKTSPSTPKWWLEAQGARLLLIKSALGLEVSRLLVLQGCETNPHSCRLGFGGHGTEQPVHRPETMEGHWLLH
jgi:hypothetical protein